MRTTLSVLAGAISAGLASAKPAQGAGALDDCLSQKDVPVSLPNSETYSELAEPYNLRYQYKPAVIVLPETNQHVQDAVKCAADSGYKVQAKSGGHSYASFSSGGKDGLMMIDLQPMQDVTLDQGSGIATVGGGSRLGNIAQAIYDQGKRALSHGTCPGVGIGGHSTHGGYGHTSRNWGLALDHIVGIDIVLADGTLKHATSTENSDVFWACRGACDSFGIVTNFYMQTHPAPDAITYWSFGFPGAYKDKKTWTDTFLHIQDFSTNSTIIDSRISHGLYLDGTAYSLSGTFFGTTDEFNSKIKPELLRGLETPTSPNVTSLDWISYLTLLGGEDTITVPKTGYDLHDTFYAKSITVPEKDKLSTKALDAFYDYIEKDSPTPWFVIVNLYGGPGSAINSKDTDFAAYKDRDSLWVFQNYGQEATDATVDYMDGMNEAIIGAQPDTDFGAYLNYVDPGYSADEAHKLYYGEELYQKLADLKKKLDPNSVFWNPQAIGA